MRHHVVSLLVLALIAAAGLAQTTQPAQPPPPADWPASVRAVAEALAETGADGELLATILPADTSIRRFDRLEPEDRLSLRAATGGAVVVAALGYEAQPLHIASDLSSAVADAEFIPEQVRGEFLLSDDPAAEKRANEIAGNWVANTLQPGVDQPIGVIVLWQQQAPESASAAPPSSLIFVLLKGELLSARKYRITQVIYGNTNQIAR